MATTTTAIRIFLLRVIRAPGLRALQERPEERRQAVRDGKVHDDQDDRDRAAAALVEHAETGAGDPEPPEAEETDAAEVRRQLRSLVKRRDQRPEIERARHRDGRRPEDVDRQGGEGAQSADDL